MPILFWLTSPLTLAADKPDSKQPINIESNYAEFDDQKGTAFYKGHVISIQGSRHMVSDTLTIYRGKDNKIDLMVATGKPARFKSRPNPDKPEGQGKANTIRYYPREDKAILIDDAELTQNGDIINGKQLTYFFQKGLLISEPKAKSRTRVILQPKEN